MKQFFSSEISGPPTFWICITSANPVAEIYWKLLIEAAFEHGEPCNCEEVD